MDVLESGRHPLPRARPLEQVIGLAAAGVALAAVAVLPLPAERQAPDPVAGPPAMAPVAVTDRSTDAELLLATAWGVLSYEVDAQRVEPVEGPATAVVPLRSGLITISDGQATGLLPDGRRTALGPADYGVAAHNRLGGWLVADGAVRAVQPTGQTSARFPLPPGRRVLAAAATGLVIGPPPGQVGEVALWRVSPGSVERYERDVQVVAASGRHVLATDCASCRRVVIGLLERGNAPLPDPPRGYRWFGNAVLSPDGSHFAGAVRRVFGGVPQVRVLVGHLPDSPRAGDVSLVGGMAPRDDGRAPLLAYSDSGWLFVAPGPGQPLLAVGPGPHASTGLPLSTPDLVELAAR